MTSNFGELENVSEVSTELGDSLKNAVGENFRTIGDKVTEEDARDVNIAGYLTFGIVTLVGLGVTGIIQLSKALFKA